MKNQNQIRQFHSEEFGSIGILMIGGKSYFPATACATVLGYKDPAKAIRMHCKGVDKIATPSAGGIQQTNYIPEGDLYRLIIRSKLPAAERFETWVFDEVLPTIRKHGAYVTYDTLDELLRSPKFAEDLINRLDKERRLRRRSGETD
jgi:prophage antirepressor-like protein